MLLTGIARGLNKPNVLVRYVDDCFIEQRKKPGKHIFDTQRRGMCLNPFTAVSIKADGAVVPCCFDFKSELVIGNVLDAELRDIWSGEASRTIQFLRQVHRQGDSGSGKGKLTMPEKCQKCYYRSPIKLVYSLLTDLIQFRQRHLKVVL